MTANNSELSLMTPQKNNLLLFGSKIHKTPLRNGSSPITDPITEMGVAHTSWQRSSSPC